jgi:ataxia telangiectasia mutated family protein
MATRISLIRSTREKEERGQLGNLISPFAQRLVEFEKKSLLLLSEAARGAHDLQVALNSIVRAQKLEVHASSIVSQEFANVLWLHKEQKLAVQFLKDLTMSSKLDVDGLALEEKLKNAVLLARLVGLSSSTAHDFRLT